MEQYECSGRREINTPNENEREIDGWKMFRIFHIAWKRKRETVGMVKKEYKATVKVYTIKSTQHKRRKCG